MSLEKCVIMNVAIFAKNDVANNFIDLTEKKVGTIKKD